MRENTMSEDLTGSCCVLCTAMNFDEASDGGEDAISGPSQAIIAIAAALSFIVMFIQ